MKFQLERILLFSDAVFAIAITLMIIEIKPPHLQSGISFVEALNEFLKETPLLMGTVLSYIMIALNWYRHHDLLKHLVSCNKKFIVLNFTLLLAISFIPFSTAFVFENKPALLPLLVYNLNYIVTAILNNQIYTYALHSKNGLVHQTLEEEISSMKKHTYFSIFVFSAVIVIAIFNPILAPMAYSLFGFYGLLDKKKSDKVEK